MTRSSCPSPEDLLAYEDDELPPTQQAELHLHIQQCRKCRTWLDESRTVGHHIRRAVPVSAGIDTRAVVLERPAATPAGSTSQADHWRRRIVAVPLAALSLALIVTLGISVFTSNSVVEGGSTFARWLRVEPFIPRVTPDQDPAQIPVAPTGPALPSGLPFALGLTSEDASTNRVERHYTAPNGLWIFVSAVRDAPPAFDSPGDFSRRSFDTVDGRVVLLEETLFPGAISTMSWSEGDILIVVLVMQQPAGYLHADDALQIVAALIEEGVEVP